MEDTFEIKNNEIQALLKVIAAKVILELPVGVGFTLLLFSYKDKDLFYISSAVREDMIRLFKEMIEKLERKVS